MRCSPSLKHQRGISLYEVLFSAVILALMTVATVTSVVNASRATRINSNSLAAKNIAEGYFEKMAIDNFSSVTQQYYPTIDYTNNPPVYLDQGLDIRCKVSFVIKGYGAVASGAGSSLTARFGAGDPPKWTTNEWAGDTLFVVFGTDVGDYLPIVSNTADTLTLGKAFRRNPDTTSRFMINNGKTVVVTTEWQYRGKTYTRSIESLIANIRESALGF